MNDDRAALDQLFRDSVSGRAHTVLHYLYFPKKEAAEEVAVKLRDLGFRTEERLGADDENCHTTIQFVFWSHFAIRFSGHDI
jgi:hypothetical protein